MAEVVKLLIKGVDYSRYVDIDTMQASNSINANQDGISFRITLNGELPMPDAGAEVVWGRFDATTGAEIEREFGGVVTTTTERFEMPTLIYEVEAESYLRHFDRRLITGIFGEQLAEDMIKAIIAEYCVGFDVTNVKAPIKVPAASFSYARPSEAIRKILDVIGYGFYISHKRTVHAYRVENLASPLPNNLLDIDNDLANYGDLVFTRDASRVYNHFTLRGFKERVPTPITLRFTGDGNNTKFDVGYAPSTRAGDIAVTVGGVNYPIKRDLVDGSPDRGSVAGVAYVHFGQHFVRFASAPGPGAQIAVTFFYLRDKTRTDQHSASVEYMKQIENTTASDGVYEYSEVDKALNGATPEAARTKLEILATKYGFPSMTGSFTSFTQGWRAGQVFRMVSAVRMGGILADRNWYVRSVTKKWIQPMHSGTTRIHYEIEFADLPYLV